MRIDALMQHAMSTLEVAEKPLVPHIMQSTESSCAVACAAMVSGKNYYELLLEMKPGTHGVIHKVLIDTLKKYGVVCDTRFRACRNAPLPHYGIVRVTNQDKSGHVIVKSGHFWLDPMRMNVRHENIVMNDKGIREWEEGRRITSFLWINTPVI